MTPPGSLPSTLQGELSVLLPVLGFVKASEEIIVFW